MTNPEVKTENVINRWREDWVDDVVNCLSDPNKGMTAIQKLSWYTTENGFVTDIFFGGGNKTDLRGLTIFGASFQGVDLEGALLDDCQLVDCNLMNVNLQHTHMNRAKLISVSLWGAKLSLACIDGGSFAQVDVSNADFHLASLKDLTLYRCVALSTNFTGADLSGSKIYEIR